jgi:hypothetical protein
MGDDALICATTVMIIATAGDLKTSVLKGFYRALGTLLGSLIGIFLIAMLPQDRMLYLFVLSLGVTFFFYLAKAYQGDETIFLLSALSMMLVFDSGNVDNVFLYGINKTMMTIFGIIIYTAIMVYIYPQNENINETKEKQKGFLWLDLEHLKTAFIIFLIFWCGVFVWIYFAIPYGFYITAFATTFSIYTLFSIISPMSLIILYTVSFLIATVSYIFILPNLYTAWHLFIFLFVYSFIGFYFINPKISIFYMMGTTLFLIKNDMSYNFAIFMFIMLIFYLFLFLLLAFDYFPFDTKPHKMFLILKKRYLFLVKSILNSNFLSSYAKKYLFFTFQKMKMYASAIDLKYYNEISKEDLNNFIKECEEVLEDIKNYIFEKQKISQKTLLLYEKISNTDFSPLKKEKF